MDMVDTSTELGKNMLSISQRLGTVLFSGYTQPQFQYTDGTGAKSFSGGDFSPKSDNRFMLRRNRIRVDWAFNNKKGELSTYFVFQFDITERGAFARDMWGRVFEHKLNMFSLTTGLFARPFGYEVNLGSADRESPERGRMSQTLMKVERDIGAAINFEPRKAKSGFMKHIKADVGVFNGQGLNGTTDYDKFKDIIGRVYTKPVKIKPLHMEVTGGASVLYGAIGSQSAWKYETVSDGQGGQKVMGDSMQSNIDKAMPRHYYGADIQIKFPSKKWTTEVRAEYIIGTQTGAATTTETPGTYPLTAAGAPAPLYIRQFNGAYFYFIQNIAGKKHQVVVKYDWYDPNANVAGTDIAAAKGFTAADIKFSTLGFGYIYHINPHLKCTLFFELVENEKTNVAGYASDVNDNMMTCRLQYRF
ncbi:MAG: porin [Bacteroidetes bacterium]|nr:porin [Bacteroidota bacterium]